MKKKIYITRKLPSSVVQLLEKSFEVKMWEEEATPVPRETLLEEVKDADALLCMLTETVDDELMAAAPHLKVISNMAVGYNNIEV